MSAPSPKEGAIADPARQDPSATGKSGESDPLIGKVISDRFRILAPIARGGMGVVYKAEQAPLGRLVALKILALKSDEEKDPEFRKRFFLEAATVAKLTHPNTVTVFDYGQGDGGLYYIAMELVNGRTLKKVLAQEGPFSAARTVHITKQICRSLREAHRLGVIHRDMKPGNVMLVDRDGEDYVKVLDFGLVKEVDRKEHEEDLTQAGVFMGSPKYMAPEQIQGEQVDARTDIYAVGVMMYEMLCGRVPFQRDNPMQILMDHVREPPPPLSPPAGMPPISPELQAIVMKCLEKKKEERYPDMEALLVALKTAAGEGVPISSASRELDVAISQGSGTPVSGVHTVGPASPAAGMPASPAARSSVAPGPVRSRAPLVALFLLACVALGGVAAWATRSRTSDVPVPSAERASAPAPTGGAPAQSLPSASALPVTPEPAPSRQVAAAHPEPPQTPLAPEPRTLLLSLRSIPAGARVRIGERQYGPTPAQVELVGDLAADGAQLTMVFERVGYRDETVTRTVQGTEMEVSVRLTPIRRSAGSSQSLGDTVVEGYRDSPY